MRAGGDVVAHTDELSVADALGGHGALAVLSWLYGVDWLERAGRPRDRSKVVCDELQSPGRIEFACDQQHSVIGLIKPVVESLQPIDRHVLDVAARADWQIRIVMPVERRGEHSFEHYESRLVLTRFILIANDGHLGVEILLRDERVDHAIGFHLDRPIEIRVGRRESLEIVCAIEESRAVGTRAVLGQFLRDVWVILRALIHQVLEQVSHTGLSVVLMSRANQISGVNGDGFLRLVGEQEDAQTVREAVFGEAFNGGDALDAFGKRTSLLSRARRNRRCAQSGYPTKQKN